MTKFRPCIDLHGGRVKQIVGGTLSDDGCGLVTNFESKHDAAWFAQRYREDGVGGGHVIMLGPGNEAAAKSALAAWPGGLQIGGGISPDNAQFWMDCGASHVIVTSWLFSKEGAFLPERLEQLSTMIGRERLVVDLSCRRRESLGWVVCMNRWQTWTDLLVNERTIHELANFCDEFLIHAADVEGKRAGMDDELISRLADWSPIPVTYAGGAATLADLAKVDTLSCGRVDLTIGSALDIFGGDLPYADCVNWNRKAAPPRAT